MGLFKAHWLSRPWLWELNKESPKSNSSSQENYPGSMEGNFCQSQIGRKRKHSSQFKNLSSVSEDVFTGQWLAAWGCCCSNLLQQKASDPIQRHSFQLWVVLCCVTCTSQLTSARSDSFLRKPLLPDVHRVVSNRSMVVMNVKFQHVFPPCFQPSVSNVIGTIYAFWLSQPHTAMNFTSDIDCIKLYVCFPCCFIRRKCSCCCITMVHAPSLAS